MLIKTLITKYFISSLRVSRLRTLLTTSFLSIAVTTASLIITYAIHQGFSQAMLKSLQTFHGDIILHSPQGTLNIEALTKFLNTHYPTITHTSPYSLKYGIIENTMNTTESTIMLLKICDLEKEMDINSFHQRVTHTSEKENNWRIDENTILIGSGLAQTLHASPGSEITLIIPESNNSNTNINKIIVRVGGTIQTGIQEFDNALVLGSYKWYQNIDSNHQYTHMSLKTSTKNLDALVTLLKKDLIGIEVNDWKKLYPGILDALALEKKALHLIIIILILITILTLIASITLLNSYKAYDCAILFVLGLKSLKIRFIFACIGTLLASMGVVFGIAIAWLFCFITTHYIPIQLPDAYYVSTLPVIFDVYYCVIICVMQIGISFITSWLTAPYQDQKKCLETLKSL